MHATCVEDLLVYQRALKFAKDVFELARAFLVDRRLVEQLNDSTDSMTSNIAEGFRQPTDRAFARYLAISLNSTEEAKTHLVVARTRGYVCEERVLPLTCEAGEIVKMLSAFIAYLYRCDRKDRLR